MDNNAMRTVNIEILQSNKPAPGSILHERLGLEAVSRAMKRYPGMRAASPARFVDAYPTAWETVWMAFKVDLVPVVSDMS